VILQDQMLRKQTQNKPKQTQNKPNLLFEKRISVFGPKTNLIPVFSVKNPDKRRKKRAGSLNPALFIFCSTRASGHRISTTQCNWQSSVPKYVFSSPQTGTKISHKISSLFFPLNNNPAPEAVLSSLLSL